jgi:hypothetical protein
MAASDCWQHIGSNRRRFESRSRLLTIVQRVAVAHLTGGQTIQRATAWHRPGFRTEHGPNAEPAATKVAASHRHAPVDSCGLPSASPAGPVTIARFIQRLDERDAVQAQIPPPPWTMHAVHGCDLRQPGRP